MKRRFGEVVCGSGDGGILVGKEVNEGTLVVEKYARGRSEL